MRINILLFLAFYCGVCATSSEDFAADTEWKYRIGPFEFEVPTEFNGGITCPVTGRIYGRVSGDITEVQWKYELDNVDQFPEYLPIFAMHVHHGAMVEGEFGGHVIGSIAGEGDIRGCVTAGPSDADPTAITYKVCSEQCLAFPLSSNCNKECTGQVINMNDPVAAQIAIDLYQAAGFWPLPGVGVGNRPQPGTLPPSPLPVLCNFSMSVATACNGGCQGDERDGNADGGSIVPSRYCDKKDDLSSSDAPQHQWLYTKYSHEMSGNEEDGDKYSEWSIFKKGNFEKMCGTKIHFLRELLSPGDKSYVALHLNFNASGSSSLDFGDLIATINDGSGTDLFDEDGEAVDLPEEKVCEEEWPYHVGPFEYENFPEINGVTQPVIARMEGRINCNWDEFQVKLTVDNEDEFPGYFPIFAMHIHHGKPRQGTTGHVVGTISGVGDIRGCVSGYTNENGFNVKVCSEKCSTVSGTSTDCDPNCQGPRFDANSPTFFAELMAAGIDPSSLLGLSGPSPGATSRQARKQAPPSGGTPPPGGTSPPPPSFPIVCNFTLAPAYGCNGGCLGDERPEDGSLGIAPSRYCDLLDDERTSDTKRDTWITVKNSFEMSGNDADGESYSPYSISKRGFFDRFCNVKLHFLKHMLRDDFGAYFALHLDFNHTGTASLYFGDMLAILNDGTGTEVRDSAGNPVTIPDDDNVKACSAKANDADAACCEVSTSCELDVISTNCVCLFDPYCCNTEWDLQCIDEARDRCGLSCAIYN